MGPAFPPAPFLRPSDLLPSTSRSPGRWPAAWRCSRPVVSRLPGLASPSPVAGSIDGRPVPSGGAGMTARWPEGHPCHRRRPPGGSVTALACRLALPCDLRVTFLAECAVCDRRQAVEACRNAHPSARLMRYLRFASPCRCQRGKRVFRYRRGLSPPVRKPRSLRGFGGSLVPPGQLIRCVRPPKAAPRDRVAQADSGAVMHKPPPPRWITGAKRWTTCQVRIWWPRIAARL